MVDKLRILWLNWKDITNPQAGGAEVFTHEVARRFVSAGNKVTLFTSSYPGAKQTETMDGITIQRIGSKTNVQTKAHHFYTEHEDSFDVVIDEINTRPFMAPCYVRKPLVALIHQLAREYWFYQTPFPLSLLGRYFLEDFWLRKYANVPTITVSNSTRKDLQQLGFSKIHVISEGLSYAPLDHLMQKEEKPTVMYLGRLVRAKRVDFLIRAFRIVHDMHQDASLWIVGDGPERSELQSIANSSVVFFGKLPKEEIPGMLARSWVLAYPSIREGFGLVIIEANACGTPAIGFDVPGVRDSILDGKTGLLARDGSERKLAECILSIIDDAALREALSVNALLNSSHFSWDKTADEFWKIVAGMFS